MCEKTVENRKTTQINIQDKKEKKRRLEITKKLPIFPKVRSSGKGVRIFWEDGRIEYWGEENTDKEADEVAKEMQLELRACLYVKEKISKLISELEEDLESFDIPSIIINNAIQGGYFSTLSMMNKLDELLLERKKNSSERGPSRSMENQV